MTDYKRLGPRLREELAKRSVHKDADPHQLADDLLGEIGARVLTSDGDGEVSLLIPAADGFEPPKKLEVSLGRDPTHVLASVPRTGTVEIDGVGRFGRYQLEPLRYKKRAEGDGAIALRGEGWSPLGFDGWFFEDLRLLIDLAKRDEGFEVRPDVELDPRDPSWTRLEPEQKSVLEDALGRALPDVVHVSAIEEALARGDAQNGALAAAMAGLRLALAPEPKIEAVAEPAFERAATRVLETVLGAGALDPERPLPKAALAFAEDALIDGGRAELADVVRRSLRGNEVAPDLLSNAVDRAFGAGFSSKRRVSIALVDRIIDKLGKKLTMDDVEVLRDVRATLDDRAQVELLGEDLADRVISTASADKKLRDTVKHLKGKSGIDDQVALTLAMKVQASVNAPRARPHVIIVSGERGPGADQVLKRALDAVGAPLTIHGDEMRLDDPVGYLTGSPAGEAGAARGRLIADAPAEGERFVARIDGLEKIGAQLADAEARARSERAFWGLISQVEREGWYRGYDPADPQKAGGARVELGGGMIVLTTSLSPKALKERMPEDLWHQLSPHVLEMGKSDVARIADEIADQVRQGVMNAGEYPDADIVIGDRAKALLRDLMDAGMNDAALAHLVSDFLVDRVAYGALEGSLSPKIRVDLHRGLTARERTELVKAWADGRVPSLAGIGACPFVLFDEGHFEGAGRGFSAKIVKDAGEAKGEVARLRALVAEYQVAISSGDHEKVGLLRENEKLSEWLGAAQERIEDVRYVNTRLNAEKKDLELLNQIAEKTIASLQKDLGAANGRIEALNGDLAQAKGAAKELKAQIEVAIRERDEIHTALRATEAQFAQAVRGMGDDAANRNPNEVFRDIVANAPTATGRYQRPILEQMFLVATAKALEQAGRYAREFDKWAQITSLARGYLEASQALGRPPDGRVLDGFERAARLSGNGWERNLADGWRRDVGLASGHQGRDPDLAGHLLRQLARMGRIRL